MEIRGRTSRPFLPGTKQRQRDAEFAASRGLDFQYVSNVINLEFPLSVEAYVHRVGRTARANNKGTALNFVSLREMPLFEVRQYRSISFLRSLLWYPPGHIAWVAWNGEPPVCAVRVLRKNLELGTLTRCSRISGS